MVDISMCMDKTCPRRFHCYRFTAVPNPYAQTYAEFSYYEGCEAFWRNEVPDEIPE